jgi:hypothetical protein
MPTHIKYAYLRHNTWTYRRTYPKALQPVLGSSLKQSAVRWRVGWVFWGCRTGRSVSGHGLRGWRAAIGKAHLEKTATARFSMPGSARPKS